MKWWKWWYTDNRPRSKWRLASQLEASIQVKIFLNQFSKSRTLGINLHLEKKDSNNNSINNRYAIKEFLIIDKNIYKSNCIKESKIMER